jgi:hypothetical protein
MRRPPNQQFQAISPARFGGEAQIAGFGASSSLPRVRPNVASQSGLPTFVIVHLKPVVC